MKKLILLLLITASFASCKKEEKILEFNIVGREYAARWKVDYKNYQHYVHLKFEDNGVVNYFTSTEKLVFSTLEKLSYTKKGDDYIIIGTLKENPYMATEPNINWKITPSKHPTYEGSTIKSSFEVNSLNFVDQRK